MDWPKINLAPYKYLKVLSKNGGPVDSIHVAEVKVFGIKQYEAYSFLSNHLKPDLPQSRLYGNCDGSGTSKYKSSAIYASISEALERWAFHTTSIQENIETLKLDIVPHSSGMAAFPGLFAGSVRKIALCEAVERWSLAHWWERKINHKVETLSSKDFGGISMQMITLEGPVNGIFISILYHLGALQSDESALPFSFYGFAAGLSKSHAIARARIEAWRNFNILSKHDFSKTDSFSSNERRLLYFAKKEGSNIFGERTKQNYAFNCARPSLILDMEVTGPWSKYSTVWRSVLGPWNANPWNENNDTYFFF